MPIIIRKGEALEAEHLIDRLREIIPGVVSELHAIRMNADGGGAISLLLSSPEPATTDQRVAVCKLIQSCVIKPAKETQGAD